MKHQFFISTEWPGGIYASPNIAGTRSGAPIVAAWAALHKLGKKGLRKNAKEIMQARDRFLEMIVHHKELRVLGDPQSSLVSVESIDPAVDIYVLADCLNQRGWFMDRQQRPAALHFTFMPIHNRALEDFQNDLSDALAETKNHPERAGEGNAAMYGMMAKIPVRSMVRLSVEKAMEGLWGRQGRVPDLRELGGEEDDAFILKLANKGMPYIQKVMNRFRA